MRPCVTWFFAAAMLLLAATSAQELEDVNYLEPIHEIMDMFKELKQLIITDKNRCSEKHESENSIDVQVGKEKENEITELKIKVSELQSQLESREAIVEQTQRLHENELKLAEQAAVLVATNCSNCDLRLAMAAQLESKLQQDVTRLSEEGRQLRPEITRLRGREDELNIELTRIRAKEEARVNKTTELQEENSQLKISNFKMNQMNERLTANVEELNNASAQLQLDIEQERRALQEARAELDSTNELLEQSLAGQVTLQETVDQLRSQLAETQDELANTTAQAEKEAVELLARLNNLKKNLEQNCQQKKIAELGLVALHGDHHYFFSKLDQKLNWTAARDFCRSKGMELASIENAEENERIRKHLTDTIRIDVLLPNAFWLGAQDLPPYDEQFIWSGTGQSLVFSDWFSGQPDDRRSQHCLAIWRSQRRGNSVQWGDLECERQQRFVCETEQPCK